MHSQSIDLVDAFEADRDAALQQFQTSVAALGEWTTGIGTGLPLHRFESDLWSNLEEHAIEHHEECDAWVIPRITPKEPLDIDPACPEAA